ncbi:hypothetical protein AT959_05660 [Dechloromonas denitrificans]|uniref:ImpA N-terminal domain-containing protein n=2 Tax=Dechloromonas denitrificans TaxID=281362 RepID=A0A133XLK6_9RHOO|nr:hypothetical protein AT959_05660 [Dechloromonas denitrificans]
MIFSAEFDAIQEARRFDDPTLAQGEWVSEFKEANWEKVIRSSEELLTQKTKDMRVVAWLIEAKGKLSGLAGLADGYALLGSLCEEFWNDIHPLPEDGDLEQRIGVFDWLTNQTLRLIREIPLTQSAKGNFSSTDHESARAMAKSMGRNPGIADNLVRSARVSLEAFETALKDTPLSYFKVQMEDAEQFKSSVKALQTILDQKMGEDTPSFGPLFDTLDNICHFFRRHAGDNSVKPAGNTLITSSPRGIERLEPSINSASGVPGNASISTRDQAIEQLKEIAEFFRRTEPHSPVAYLADKAAKWGRMPLHEWLRSIVKDDTALSRMEELLGVEAKTSESA